MKTNPYYGYAESIHSADWRYNYVLNLSIHERCSHLFSIQGEEPKDHISKRL